jgi:hypothetical protein
MIRENSQLLKLNLKKEQSFISLIRKSIYDCLFSLFDLILENPFENIWYESISIILGYLQLIVFLLDRTVRKFI